MVESSSDVLGRCADGDTTMLKLLLISIVVVPVLLGMQAARTRNGTRGLLLLLGVVLAYDVFYILVLYYVRVRWLGWGG
jgi:hypothetical protein